jgi:CheY-like chemotaxis protein
LVASLRETDRRKDEFLATLAHELRNPLAPLRSSLQVMGMTGLSKAHRPLHGIMERQVNHLARLVDDLLEVSRITRGAIQLRMDRIDIATVVRNAIETSEPHMRAAGHEFEVQLPDDPLWVQGDVVRLAQIVSNLLNNASAYTAAGGRIALVVAQERSQVAVRISDTGRGIAPEQLEDIFRMFHRGASATDSPSAVGGLGIGLSLARHLAQLHGGSLHARSEGPGLGSEFTLKLPLALSAPAAEAAAPAPGSQAVGLRVLVVDDNADARESLAMLLRCLGAVVQVAADGPHGLDAHAEQRFDVILLDIGMPVMGGLEVARRIRAAGGRQPILVALTGWGQPEDRDRSRDAGFDHHLLKPVELDVLQELLGTLANQAAGAPLGA